jgi:hypothetical protein
MCSAPPDERVQDRPGRSRRLPLGSRGVAWGAMVLGPIELLIVLVLFVLPVWGIIDAAIRPD